MHYRTLWAWRVSAELSPNQPLCPHPILRAPYFACCKHSKTSPKKPETPWWYGKSRDETRICEDKKKADDVVEKRTATGGQGARGRGGAGTKFNDFCGIGVKYGIVRWGLTDSCYNLYARGSLV